MEAIIWQSAAALAGRCCSLLLPLLTASAALASDALEPGGARLTLAADAAPSSRALARVPVHLLAAHDDVAAGKALFERDWLLARERAPFWQALISTEASARPAVSKPSTDHQQRRSTPTWWRAPCRALPSNDSAHRRTRGMPGTIPQKLTFLFANAIRRSPIPTGAHGICACPAQQHVPRRALAVRVGATGTGRPAPAAAL